MTPEDEATPIERLLTMEEAAVYLGIAPSTLQRWVHRRQIPHVRMGDRGRVLIRFRPEGLREWVKTFEVPAKPRRGQEADEEPQAEQE